MGPARPNQGIGGAVRPPPGFRRIYPVPLDSQRPIETEADAKARAEALARQAEAVAEEEQAHVPAQPNDVPRPIGPERLKALREAIESGTYPADEHVMGGLVRMFRPSDDGTKTN